MFWRKGWDSNPRYPCRHAGFQDRCLKPLGHPSSSGIQGLSRDASMAKERTGDRDFGGEGALRPHFIALDRPVRSMSSGDFRESEPPWNARAGTIWKESASCRLGKLLRSGGRCVGGADRTAGGRHLDSTSRGSCRSRNCRGARRVSFSSVVVR
jgi:hypothetical protein